MKFSFFKQVYVQINEINLLYWSQSSMKDKNVEKKILTKISEWLQEHSYHFRNIYISLKKCVVFIGDLTRKIYAKVN